MHHTDTRLQDEVPFETTERVRSREKKPIRCLPPSVIDVVAVFCLPSPSTKLVDTTLVSDWVAHPDPINSIAHLSYNRPLDKRPSGNRNGLCCTK